MDKSMVTIPADEYANLQRVCGLMDVLKRLVNMDKAYEAKELLVSLFKMDEVIKIKEE